MSTGREQILEAAVAEIEAYGYAETTVEGIAERAGISTPELQRHYFDKEEICRDAVKSAFDRFDRHMLPLYARPQPWRQRIRAVAFAAASYCCDHEQEVRFALGERRRVGGLAGGDRSLRLHLGEVDSVRQELSGRDPAPAAAEFVVGTFLQAVVRACHRDVVSELETSIPGLLFGAYVVYLGSEAANREFQWQELWDSEEEPPADATF